MNEHLFTIHAEADVSSDETTVLFWGGEERSNLALRANRGDKAIVYIDDLSLRVIGESRDQELALLDHVVVTILMGDLVQAAYPGTGLQETNTARKIQPVIVPERQSASICISPTGISNIRIRVTVYGRVDWSHMRSKSDEMVEVQEPFDDPFDFDDPHHPTLIKREPIVSVPMEKFVFLREIDKQYVVIFAPDREVAEFMATRELRAYDEEIKLGTRDAHPRGA